MTSLVMAAVKLLVSKSGPVNLVGSFSQFQRLEWMIGSKLEWVETVETRRPNEVQLARGIAAHGLVMEHVEHPAYQKNALSQTACPPWLTLALVLIQSVDGVS